MKVKKYQIFALTEITKGSAGVEVFGLFSHKLHNTEQEAETFMQSRYEDYSLTFTIMPVWVNE